jgi:hypothetical protein
MEPVLLRGFPVVDQLIFKLYYMLSVGLIPPALDMHPLNHYLRG